jgi:hypothetical protein
MSDTVSALRSVSTKPDQAQAHRNGTDAAQVEFTSDAFALVRMLFRELALDSSVGQIHRTVRLAALAAIGMDPDRPMITPNLIAAAHELACEGQEVMTAGLDRERAVRH